MRRYVSSMRVPKSVAAGRVLCHNHIRHTVDMPCGVNAFRAWTDNKPPSGFVECPCGWSGLPHYAHRDHVKVYRQGYKMPTDWRRLERTQG